MQIQGIVRSQGTRPAQARQSSAPEPRDTFEPSEDSALRTLYRMNAGFMGGALVGMAVGGVAGDFRTGGLVGASAGTLYAYLTR